MFAQLIYEKSKKNCYKHVSKKSHVVQPWHTRQQTTEEPCSSTTPSPKLKLGFLDN
jgi:hypothetical protein